MVRLLDREVYDFAAQYLVRFPSQQEFAEMVVGNDLVKGGILVAALWWFWNQPHQAQPRRREVVVMALLGALGAAALSRAICILIPFRARPIVRWDHGSFPSDHAALGFALATGLLVLHPPVGALAMLYVSFLVCVPRVLLGIHWMTDVFGGAALGMAVAWLLTRPAARSRLARPILGFFERYPGASYAALFLFSYGVLTRGDDVRSLTAWAFQHSSGVTGMVRLP